jgi:hypothetical protein
MILDGTIVNADINSAAAIAYSKLNLATSIVNGDISASAAIALSKLATTGTITATTFVGALTGTASGNLVSGGALGTPSSGTLTNCTFPTVPNATNATNATNAGNAATVGSISTGFLSPHGGRNNEANKIVRTQENGYILCGYINSSNGNEGNNSSPPRVWGTNGGDDYLRSYLTSALNVNSANSAGNSNTVGGFSPSASDGASTVAVRSAGDGALRSSYFVGSGTVSVGSANGTTLRRRNADGYFLIDGSRLKYKENVETVSTEDAISLIKNLRPVKFKWKKEFRGPDDLNPLLNEIQDTNKEYGFIAEEVHQVSPELVTYLDDNEDGVPDPNMWQPNAVISILVKTVQDLVSRIEHLESNGAN